MEINKIYQGDCLEIFNKDWADDMKEKIEEAILADYKNYFN